MTKGGQTVMIQGVRRFSCGCIRLVNGGLREWKDSAVCPDHRLAKANYFGAKEGK